MISDQQGMAGEAALELLMDGARYGDGDDVEEALRQKAPVNGADEQGRTALHMAAANGHDTLVALLLSHLADAQARNAEGNTPLHYACLNGHASAARLLLERGASPAALNEHSRSPVDECLGKAHQEELLAVLQAFSPAGDSPGDGAEGAEIPEGDEADEMQVEPAEQGGAAEGRGQPQHTVGEAEAEGEEERRLSPEGGREAEGGSPGQDPPTSSTAHAPAEQLAALKC